MNYRMMLGVAALAAVCTGCAAASDESESWEEIAEDAEDEEIGRLEAAIGEATCRTASADATFQAGGTLNIQSGYDNPNCDKAYVIRINNWTASPSKYFILTWNDTKPANSIVCQGTKLRMDTYKLVNGSFQFDATRESTGEWRDGKCSIAAAGRLVPSSGTWKVAVQGIWNVQGTPTYNIKFQTS